MTARARTTPRPEARWTAIAALLALALTSCGRGAGDPPPPPVLGAAPLSEVPEPGEPSEPTDPRDPRDPPIDEASLPPASPFMIDPTDRALDPFYAALARTEAREANAITRVVHMGDSSIGMDVVPHMLREPLQARFGDAGPGFVLLEPHSASYHHTVAALTVEAPWEQCFIIFRCKRDGRYGLGGVSFESTGGAETRFQLRRRGTEPRVTSRFELWYAAHRTGGRFEIGIGRQRPVRIDTRAPELEDRFHTIDLEPRPYTFTVRAAGGPVRAYGVVMESPGPGLVWDSLSMIGSFTSRLLAHDAEHIAGQVRRRSPDLLVFGYGGNDLRRVAARNADRERLTDETRRVIRHIRAGKPEAACLWVAINDHRASGQQPIGWREVETVVEAQRAAAAAEGCAFFDTYAALGGRGSVERWLREDPPLVAGDLKHLSRRGRALLAGHIHDALIAGYERYRARALGRAER